MNAAEKAALTKLVTSATASDLAVFDVTETDAKSAGTAITEAKALIGRKKGDYAIVVLRKT